MQLFQSTIEIIWFLLPGYVANMAPVLAARLNWLPSLNVPIDARRTWNAVRLLGDNKTWRGIVVGAIAGGATGIFQYIYINFLVGEKEGLISYEYLPYVLLVSITLGLSALLGDAVKSFIKRRLNFAPGESWMPWDQLDSTLGMIVATYIFFTPSIAHVAVALFVALLGTYIVNISAVTLRIKKNI